MSLMFCYRYIHATLWYVVANTAWAPRMHEGQVRPTALHAAARQTPHNSLHMM